MKLNRMNEDTSLKGSMDWAEDEKDVAWWGWVIIAVLAVVVFTIETTYFGVKKIWDWIKP